MFTFYRVTWLTSGPFLALKLHLNILPKKAMTDLAEGIRFLGFSYNLVQFIFNKCHSI